MNVVARTLVWSDEFNGSGRPDSANWNYHVGNGFNTTLGGFQGWGNGEWQWYRPENCTQSDGNLRIQATWRSSPRNVGGRLWYQDSCRITTQGKRSWKYGRIEARIAAPNASGAWPAFWMLGDSSGGSNTGNYNPPADYYDTMAGNWASCGEIDIFESMNTNNFTINNIFWDNRVGVFPWAGDQNANYERFPRPTLGSKDQFHVYAIEWDQTFVRWFVDDVETHIIDIRPAQLEEFHKPLYLIMNLALAGTLPNQGPGNPTPQAGEFPLTMYVDYVRVYQ